MKSREKKRVLILSLLLVCSLTTLLFIFHISPPLTRDEDQRQKLRKTHRVTKKSLWSIVPVRLIEPVKPHNKNFSVWPANDFEVIVLTMDRAKSLNRLLISLNNTHYGGDIIKVIIKIDYSFDNEDVIATSIKFQRSFCCGPVVIEVAEENRGLRDAWLQAVSVNHGGEVMILEDDVEVSPVWYIWIRKMWQEYEHRDDIAGITLYRQTLIPKEPAFHREIVNNHEPFLFALVGSIGFSPHPKQWSKFIRWTQYGVDIDSFDFTVPNLIFSYWWNAGDRRSMWTQLYIYYTVMHDLFTIHINLPGNVTLASDMRESGVHFPSSYGRDFSLAETLNTTFPQRLRKYGFDGRLLPENTSARSSLY